jgi:hypothetical protein
MRSNGRDCHDARLPPTRASSVARAGLQYRQLHADAGVARGGHAVVADQSAGEKLIKIGAKVVHHVRYAAFQMAEVAMPKELFKKILRLIDGLQPPSAPA